MARKNVLLALALVTILPSTICDPAYIGKIGEACGPGSSLCSQHASCLNQQCTCDNGYVASNDLRSCLPLVDEWEGACTANEQCQKFVDAKCRDGVCECELGHHYLSPKCWINKHLNDHCSDNNECILSPNQDRIECNDGVCRCKSGYQQSELGDQCNGCSAVWSLGLVSLTLIGSIQLFFN